jgi:hypothetical protein
MLAVFAVDREVVTIDSSGPSLEFSLTVISLNPEFANT